MADNKQYISQDLDNGSIMISEDVIGTIVIHAVKDVEGVIGLSAKPGSDIVEKIGKKNWGKGFKVHIAEDNTLTISCNVVVAYGHNVVSSASGVQQAISGAIESMAGVKVCAVNVNICEIVRQ